MNILKAPEKLVVCSTNPYLFIVIGCGGTGSYLVRDLARIVGVYNRQYGRKDRLLIIDKDVVEEKNLARQNFIIADVGKNKAQVLASRYSKSYGVEIGAMAEYLRQDNINTIYADSNNCSLVFIGCVDNNKTRHLIHKMYRNNGSFGTCYIDSGNEEFAGQVVFSTTMGYTTNGQQIDLRGGYYGSGTSVKDAVELFQLNADDKHPDELSCADHAVSAPQNIATNIMAANVIFNYCNAMICASAHVAPLARQPDTLTLTEGYSKTRAINAHVCYFNSSSGTIKSQPFDDKVTEIVEKYRKSREQWVIGEKQRRGITAAEQEAAVTTTTTQEVTHPF